MRLIIMDPLIVLIRGTYTKNDAVRRLRLLSEFVNFLAFKNVGAKNLPEAFGLFKTTATRQSFRPHINEDIAFFESLPAEFYGYFRPTEINFQLKKMEDSINGLKIVQLYIPFELPAVEGEKLGKWFKQNYGELSLYDVIYDPQLIGGCALSVNGVYRDYSLRAKINDNKGRVIAELTAYKRQ